MAPPDSVITELWIYPVKSCRGVSVQSAQLTPFGLEFDRTWCIVDCDGINVSKCEAISQRKIPILATVAISFSHDRQLLLLDAPGMKQFSVPTALDAYAEEQEVQVESCGRSTTSGEGWSLGFMQGRSHAVASAWISEYLNREVDSGGKRVSGFKTATSYAFVRNVSGLEMSMYPPVLPVIARCKGTEVFNTSARRFADFAPVLLANQASAQFIGERCVQDDGQALNDDYPIGSFRANIIVGGKAKAWTEETWRQIAFLRSSGEPTGITMKKIKESARCTVPCRNQSTGGFVFQKSNLQFWKVYGKVFPRKAKDADWGSWAGPFFGVYMSYGKQEGILCVGDHIQILETCQWDDHVRQQCNLKWVAGVGAVVVLAAAALARARTR